MSEFIKNNDQKIERLFKFFSGFINGEDGNKLIEEFKGELENITPHDIIVMEDKQIEMGVTTKEIKQHIEKFLNVLSSYLDKYNWEKPEKGHPLYYLMLENRVLENKLEDMKKIIAKIDSKNNKRVNIKEELLKLKECLEELKEFDKHYIRKENILFPYLEKKWENYRPLQVMWSLHDDIRRTLKRLINELKVSDVFNIEIRKDLGELFFLMFNMIFKEDKIIYPIAVETLNNNEWKEIQKQSQEIGYSFIEEPLKDEMIYDKSVMDEGIKVLSNELFKLDIGELSLKQINLLINTLPVDITFVDENDKVRFFSKPEERFFPRSSAIIGRSVQNCHPSESVHIVNKILEAFKSGDKSKAEFWLQMKGKYILIRYFAMRDKDGNYKGALEVGQDITEIKKIKGEKRLLEWE